MASAKRIFLFLAVNFLVVLMISLLLSVFHVRPYLQAYGINYTALMIFCVAWGMGGAFISLALSRVAPVLIESRSCCLPIQLIRRRFGFTLSASCKLSREA
jgi:hypothetical protein